MHHPPDPTNVASHLWQQHGNEAAHLATLPLLLLLGLAFNSLGCSEGCASSKLGTVEHKKTRGYKKTKIKTLSGFFFLLLLPNHILHPSTYLLSLSLSFLLLFRVRFHPYALGGGRESFLQSLELFLSLSLSLSLSPDL